MSKNNSFSNKLKMLCNISKCFCMEKFTLKKVPFLKKVASQRKRKWNKDNVDLRSWIFIRNSTFKIREHIDKNICQQRQQLNRCKVIWDYEAENPDELDLKTGQILILMGIEEDGWWKGWNGFKFGVFPSNFVKKLYYKPKMKLRQKLSLPNNRVDEEEENENRKRKYSSDGSITLVKKHHHDFMKAIGNKKP